MSVDNDSQKKMYERLFPGFSSTNHQLPVIGEKLRALFSIPETSNVTSDGTQASTDSLLDKIRRDAEFMAHDLIMNFGKENAPQPPNTYCKTLRRTVTEISNEHNRFFRGIGNRLKLDEESALQTFVIIGDEIFQGGQVNWGRIIALYAFAAHMAKYLTDNEGSVDPELKEAKQERKSESLKKKIAVFVGQYIGNKLGKWILNNGGWDTFVEYFPEQGEFEAKVMKGILFTAVGLGALATLYAAR